MRTLSCNKCSGRMFLDRTFSDNKSYEVYCVMCGQRDFIYKTTELGVWLSKVETERKISGLAS